MSPTQAAKKIILDFDELEPYIKRYRQQGKKIVLTQGSFDMVHIGHARYCEKAKSYGDVLIVGVDSDEKVRKRKGPDRPIVPQEERLEMLTYLNSVDLVVLKDVEKEKWSYIKSIKPDVLIATKETYTPEKIKALKKWCGEVVVLDPQATTSTSAKIRRVQIGAAHRIGEKLSQRIITAMEEVLKELKEE